MRTIFIVIATVSIFCLSACFLFAGDTKYAHIVSWGSWDGNRSHQEETEIYLDGASIGPLVKACKRLNSLPLKKGEIVKLDISLTSNSEDKSSPIYSHAAFLKQWVAQGVVIVIAGNGVEKKLHTLTWKWNAPVGSIEDPMWTTRPLYLDNHDIGQGELSLEKLSNIELKKGDILAVLFPYSSAPFGASFYPKNLEETLRKLSASKGIVVEEIIPYL